jgi:riboflavin kinase / FMN adenylyltransferase
MVRSQRQPVSLSTTISYHGEESVMSLEAIWQVTGFVVRGQQRGRQIGYPTANLQQLAHVAVPPDGVYAGYASEASGRLYRYPAAVSVGTNTTFQAAERTVEAYLLDFEGDLYGKLLTVELVQRLRSMITFDGVDELIATIEGDVRDTRVVLGDNALSGG